MTRLTLLALLLVVACSSPGQTHRTGGLDLDAADWATIDAAAADWCEATEGACCPSTDLVTPVSAEQCQDRTGVPCRGYYTWATGEIGLVTAALRTDLHLRHVILHELGHACGVGHLEQPDAVMRAGGAAVRLTSYDVNAWRTSASSHVAVSR